MRTPGLAAFAAILVGLSVAQDVTFVAPEPQVAEAPPVYVPAAADADASSAPEPEAIAQMPNVVGMSVTEAVLAIRDVDADIDVLLFAEEFHANAPSKIDPALAEELTVDTHPEPGEPLQDGFAGLLVGESRFEFPDGELAEPWWWPAHALQAAEGTEDTCLRCHSEGSCVQCHVQMANRYAVEPDGTYVLEAQKGTTATLQDLGALEKAVESAVAGLSTSTRALGMSGSLGGDVFAEIEMPEDPAAVAAVVRVCVPAAFDTAPGMASFVVRCFAPGERLPFAAVTVEQETARAVSWSGITAETLAESVDSYRDLR